MTNQEPSEQDWLKAALKRVRVTWAAMKKDNVNRGCFHHTDPPETDIYGIQITREEALAEMRKRTEIAVTTAQVEAAYDVLKNWQLDSEANLHRDLIRQALEAAQKATS